MRPDEHKKKRSEQYKKKHSSKFSKSKVDSNSQHVQHFNRKKTTPHTPEDSTVNNDNSEINCDEEHQKPFRKFERRKISSNWERYEELDGKEHKDLHEASLKGADFQNLLQNTTGSRAHFRFKDEQLWQDGLEDESFTISIDCDSLLSAVQCVPINDRLSIESKHFEEKHLENFKDCANNHLVNYNRKLETNDGHSTVKACCTTSSVGELDLPISKDIDNKKTELSGTVCIPDSRDFVATDMTKSLTVAEQCETASILDNERAEKIPSPIAKSENKETSDDELDDILNVLDVKSKEHVDLHISDKCSTKVNRASDQKEFHPTTVSLTAENVDFEDQLDQLLDLDCDTKKNVQKAEIEAKSPLVEVSSNLEDWLDTILDE